jgi:hypothetical protein
MQKRNVLRAEQEQQALGTLSGRKTLFFALSSLHHLPEVARLLQVSKEALWCPIERVAFTPVPHQGQIIQALTENN